MRRWTRKPEPAPERHRGPESSIGELAAALPGGLYQYRLSASGEESFPFVSRGLEPLMGVTAEAVYSDPGTGWIGIWPEDQEQMRLNIMESARTMRPWSADFRVCQPDGSVRWMRGLSYPARDERDGSILWTGYLTDITDCKETEKVLHESQLKLQNESAMLQGIIYGNPHAILVLDGEGRPLIFNESLVQLFGAGTPDSYCLFEDKFLLEHGYEKDLARIREGTSVRLSGLHYNPRSFDEKLPDREVIFNAVIFPVIDEAGQISAIVVMYEDVGDKARYEQSLRNSESMYRAIFQNTGSASLLVDNNRTVILVNDEWARACGYMPAEVEGRMSWTEFVAEEDLPALMDMENRQRLLPDEAAGIVKHEFRLRTRNGEHIMVIGHIARIPGTPLRIVSLLDITERTLAEQRFQVAFTSNPVPMTISLADNGPYVEVNNAALEFAGYTPDEVIGKTVLEVGVYTPEAVDTMTWLFKEQGHIRDLETVVTIKGGNKRLALLNAHQVIINGKRHILASILDITERKTAEAKFHAAFHSNPTPMTISELGAGPYLDVNEAALRFTGYTRTEVIGHTREELNLHSPESLAEMTGMIRTNGRIRDWETVIRAKDGTCRHAIVNSEIISINGREHVISTTLDISERKMVEEELRRSESRFKGLMEQATQPIVLFDPDGLMRDANAAWEDMWGTSRERAIGKYNIFLDSRPEFQALMPKIRQAFAGFPTEFPEILVSSDTAYNKGAGRWLTGKVYPLRDSEGTIQALVVMQEDISERKQTELDLKQSEERFRNLAEASPSAIMIFQDDVYVYVNPGATQITGYPAEELLGMPFYEIVHPDHKEMVRQRGQARQMGGNEHHHYEFCILTKDGETRWVDFAGERINYRGRPAGILTAFDVTERKKAETRMEETLEALKESEEKYRRLLLYSSDPIFALDRQGDYIYVNEAFARPFGKTPEGIIGRNMRDLFNEEETRVRMAAVWEVFASREPKEIEVTVRAIDGGLRYYVTLIDPIMDASGEVVSVSCISREITMRKRAEKALQVSEEKYRSLFVNTPAGVLNYDCDLIVTDCNDRFLEMFELERPAIIGTDLKVIENRQVLAALCRSVEGQESFYQGEYWASFSPAGKYVYLHTAPFYRSDGSLAGGLAIIEDITERRAMEIERDRLQQLLTSILDSMPSILVGIDARGHINQWNREAMLRTGLSAEDVRGREIELVLPVFRLVKRDIEAALKDGSVKRQDRLTNYDKGEAQFFEAVVYPLVSQELQGAVIRLDDITEKVRLEEMMIQTEKMMSVGGMAAGMAHEINNPLGGILQGAQNVLRRLRPDSKVNRRMAEECGTDMDQVYRYVEYSQILTFVEGIRSSGIRASNIISNMLQFSRGSSLHKSYADLAEMLDRTIELASSDYDLKKRYDFRHIEIIRDYAPDMPPVLCSDVEIEQVVFNLLRNAAQAVSGYSGQPQIAVHTHREGDWAVIQVSDNGPGIEENIRRRIFEPFYTTKETGVGTGLGLAVSYFIITNNHKGQIYVESNPGEGAVFTIRLPFNDGLDEFPA